MKMSKILMPAALVAGGAFYLSKKKDSDQKLTKGERFQEFDYEYQAFRMRKDGEMVWTYEIVGPEGVVRSMGAEVFDTGNSDADRQSAEQAARAALWDYLGLSR